VLIGIITEVGQVLLYSDGCRIFLRGAIIPLHIKTFQWTKMSLFGYSLDILCMEHLRFGWTIGGGCKLQRLERL